MSDFELMKTIGCGAYGNVFKAKNMNDGTMVAIKSFPVSKTKRPRGSLSLHEIDSIKKCSEHPAVVHLIDVTNKAPFKSCKGKFDNYHLVLEFCEQDCQTYLYNITAPVTFRKRILRQLVEGLRFMHAMGYGFRDIKPSNVLIVQDDKYNVLNGKWCDFGMLKLVCQEEKNSEHVSTIPYKSPEHLLSRHYYKSKKIDIWSLGVMFHRFFAKTTMFHANTDEDLLKCIFSKIGWPGQEVFDYICHGRTPLVNPKAFKNMKGQTISSFFQDSNNPQIKQFEHVPHEGMCKNFGTLEQFIDMVSKMLVIDPRKRSSIEEVASHQFWDDIPEESDVEEHHKWMGLYRSKVYQPKKYKYNITSDVGARKHAMDTLKTMGKTKRSYKIIFATIDLTDRVLVKCGQLSENDIKNLTYACGYLVSKYLLRCSCCSIESIFANFDCKRAPEIRKWENKILKLVDYEIYRSTLYDYLPERDKKVGEIGKLMFERAHSLDGAFIRDVATIFLANSCL